MTPRKIHPLLAHERNGKQTRVQLPLIKSPNTHLPKGRKRETRRQASLGCNTCFSSDRISLVKMVQTGLSHHVESDSTLSCLSEWHFCGFISDSGNSNLWGKFQFIFAQIRYNATQFRVSILVRVPIYQGWASRCACGYNLKRLNTTIVWMENSHRSLPRASDSSR